MRLFKITDPKPHDILVYNDMSRQFVNVEPTTENLNIQLPEFKVVKVSSNSSLISKFDNNKLYTKGLKAGKNVNINVF